MTRLKQFIQFALPLFFSLFVLMSSAVAEEGVQAEASPDETEAHEGGGHHEGLNFVDFSNKEAPPLVALLFNFTALVVIVFLLMKKPLSARFKDRKAVLVKALEEASAAKTAAEAAISEARAKMDAVDKEMESIRAGIVAAGEKEAARIAAAAEARSERLASDAQMLASQEIARMAESVRREIVERIVAEASDIIRERITEADKDSLTSKYLAELGRETQSATEGK